MSRRRSLTGRPLLVASAGVLVTVGCGAKGPPNDPVGNLMAPEAYTAHVCVDVAPPEAHATVQVGGVVAAERCVDVSAGPGSAIPVWVSAPGFLSQSLEVRCMADLPPLAVVLVPGEDPAPSLEPVGNLMMPIPDDK